MSKLRCQVYNVVATWLQSKYVIDVVTKTSDTTLKPRSQTTSPRRQYYDLEPRLCQHCEERQVWIVHGRMVAFP